MSLMTTLGTPKGPTHSEIIILAGFESVKFLGESVKTVCPPKPSTASTNQSYMFPSCFTWGTMNWSKAGKSPTSIGT